MVGEQFDSSNEPQGTDSRDIQTTGRRFLGVQFACCAVYARIYVNQNQNAYIGNCPKCGRRVQFQIGPGGTDSRFFTAY